MGKFFKVIFEVLCPSVSSLFLGVWQFFQGYLGAFLPRVFGGVDGCFLKTSYLLLPLAWLVWCVWVSSSVNCCHFSP